MKNKFSLVNINFKKLFFYGLLAFIFSKEIVLLNEEFILIVAVICFIYVAYRPLSDIFTLELDNRASMTMQVFSAFYILQRSSVSDLISLHKRTATFVNSFAAVFASGENFMNLVGNFSWSENIHAETYYNNLLSTLLFEDFSLNKNLFLHQVEEVHDYFLGEYSEETEVAEI